MYIYVYVHALRKLHVMYIHVHALRKPYVMYMHYVSCIYMYMHYVNYMYRQYINYMTDKQCSQHYVMHVHVLLRKLHVHVSRMQNQMACPMLGTYSHSTVLCLQHTCNIHTYIHCCVRHTCTVYE